MRDPRHIWLCSRTGLGFDSVRSSNANNSTNSISVDGGRGHAHRRSHSMFGRLRRFQCRTVGRAESYSGSDAVSAFAIASARSGSKSAPVAATGADLHRVGSRPRWRRRDRPFTGDGLAPPATDARRQRVCASGGNRWIRTLCDTDTDDGSVNSVFKARIHHDVPDPADRGGYHHERPAAARLHHPAERVDGVGIADVCAIFVGTGRGGHGLHAGGRHGAAAHGQSVLDRAGRHVDTRRRNNSLSVEHAARRDVYCPRPVANIVRLERTFGRGAIRSGMNGHHVTGWELGFGIFAKRVARPGRTRTCDLLVRSHAFGVNAASPH